MENKTSNENKTGNSIKPDVMGWLAMDEIKPESDYMILVTNGSFVEICYYEDGELMKPFRYDSDDTPTFKSQQSGLKWIKLELPICP